MLRTLAIPLFALALALPLGNVAHAEDGTEVVAGEPVSDPGSELFRQALSDYRTALAELRELCSAGDDDAGVSTARRRAPKTQTACERGRQELRSFLVEVRRTAHWVREQAAQEREARRAAKEAEKAAREKAEREDKDRAEQAKRNEAARLEKAKQDEKARQAEKAKQEQQKAANDQAKARSGYEAELAKYRAKAQKELADWAQGERAANELRLLAATKTGEERARYEQKAADEAAHAAEHRALAATYQVKVAELERLVASAPKSSELLRKAQKLRDQIASIEGTIAYKRGLEQDAADKAAEYRAMADERTGPEREKYLYKASEMDRQADEWARLASEYEAQRDQLEAELAALGL